MPVTGSVERPCGTTSAQTSLRIPKLNERSENSHIQEYSNIPFLGRHEILAICKKHIFNARLEHDRAHRPLLTSTIESPAAIRTAGVDHEYYYKRRKGNTYVSARKI